MTAYRNCHLLFILIISLMVAGFTCYTTQSQSVVAGITDSMFLFDHEAPAALDDSNALTVWATQYYIYRAAGSGTIPLLDKTLKPLGYYLDTCDWCKAAIEGTLYITDTADHTVVLNYDGRSGSRQVYCKACGSLSHYTNEGIGYSVWAISKGYGDGVMGNALVPFRTIAVDPHTIPYGTVLYIPAARGIRIELPGGKKAIHDGYFYAADTGEDIKGNHIDVFTGLESSNPFSQFVTSDSDSTFKVYRITDTSVINRMLRIHKR